MKGIALGGCIISGFSDWLDGYIARTYDQKTVLGAFLDPVADKIFIGSLVLGLTMKGLLPLPLAVIILGRDVILVAASFIMRARERPPGAPFFDTTTSATFEIVPSEFSKINTGCQITLLIVSLGNFALDIPSIDIIEPMWWIISVTTVGSGLGYLDGSGIKRIPKLDEKAKFSPHDK
jgi:cardiolipin synthase